MAQKSKGERLAIFIQKLRVLPRCSTHDEAYEQGLNLMTAIEDELALMPCVPENWQSDGRLYWPLMDRAQRLSAEVVKYRSFAHETFIGCNGSLLIRARAGDVLLSKPGQVGRTVPDLLVI